MVRNILFVDDDSILRQALEQSLAKYSESFSLVTACDGFDAVKQLKKTAVSLVILDLIMPRMDGMSLLNHLRENYSDLPALIVSSMDDAYLLEITKLNGVIGYLKKPFHIEKLVSIITEVLRIESVGGIMHDISPAVFLQFIEMDAKSCTIRIFDNATHQGGIIYFRDGEMLDARIGASQGIEAACELFSWDTATIFMQNECKPRDNKINSSLTPMIMKAVGLKDETGDQDLAESSGPAFQEVTNKSKISSSDFAGIELLKKNLGESLGLKKYYQDTQVTDALLQLDKVCKNNQFGAFQFAYINEDRNSRLLLPGPPPTVLEVDPKCSPEKIIDFLKSAKNR